MFESPSEALKYIADHDIAMVDLKVVGITGQWMHLTIPANRFTEKHFEEGVGYDGSSGSGFGKVESGDVSARPEPTAAFARIAHAFAFYPGRVACYVAGERVRPQPGYFYGGWITDEIAGPVKGEPDTGHW